jgi:small subunit ribosomal protein S3
MGNKVNPTAFRLGGIFDWKSRWFGVKGDYQKNLQEDIKIRKFLQKKLRLAGLVTIQIERSIHKIKIIIAVSRPGVVIGRGGSGLEELKKELIKLVSVPNPEKNLEIIAQEVKNPDLYSYFVAQRVAEQIEKRMSPRKVALRMIERVMGAGAKGIKIIFTGRIDGAEIARKQVYGEGKIPLSTLRADIDFSSCPAFTRSGYVGVKVWIYKGERSA